MMNNLIVLFKNDIIQKTALFKEGKKQRDILGIISSLVLAAAIYGAFVYVFKMFAKLYLETTFTDPANGILRLTELTRVVYCAVFILGTAVGVGKIYQALLKSNDSEVLLCQPVSSGTIFLYKLIKIYFSQVASAFIMLTPLAIVTDILSPLGGAGFYLLTLLNILLMPLAMCAIASILSIPYMYLMRKIENKFVLRLIVYIALIGVGFWIYSGFLNVFSQLLGSGQIKYVFDRNTVNAINKFSLYLYPSNFFVEIIFKNNIGINLLAVILISAVSTVAAYFIIQKLYAKTLQIMFEGQKSIFSKKNRPSQKSILGALISKEFINVIRTPSYAFQYFATIAAMPFMVFICVSLLRSLMSTLLFINCDYELSVFVISMFSILSNTFCATNISREGKMFSMLKTTPLSCYDVMKAKLIFSGVVSAAAVLLSCVVLLCFGFLKPFEALFLFFIGILMSFSEIAYSTRKDMNNPNFPQNENDEVTQTNSNISLFILIGLLASVLIGGGALVIRAVLSFTPYADFALLFSLAFVTLVASIVFAFSLLRLFRGLKRQYYDFES